VLLNSQIEANDVSGIEMKKISKAFSDLLIVFGFYQFQN
jgi:hypothetical protein